MNGRRWLWLLTVASWAWATPPLTVREGGFETAAGQPNGLFGVSLAPSVSRWDPAPARASLQRIAALGFNLVRLPLAAADIMPVRGVLPDDAEYALALQARGDPTGFVAWFDELVAEADRLDLYLLPELHELTAGPGPPPADAPALADPAAPDWLADDDALRQELPAIWGWLAAHARGRASLAGLELPCRELPVGSAWSTGEGFKALAADCAAAVKAADPERLCFLAIPEGGAGVNRLEPAMVWDLPADIDVLAPRFYLGLHSSQATEAGAYGTAPASWLSWFRGSGKPVVVAEYGPAHSRFPEYQKYDASASATQRLHDACLAGWYLNGAQGVIRWVWDEGLDDPGRGGQVSGGAAALLKYGPLFRSRPRAEQGQVAVVLASSRRAPYAADRDLLRLAAALLDQGVAPFDCLFAEQVAAAPDCLAGYRAILIYTPELAPAVIASVADRAFRTLRLAAADGDGEPELRDFLAAAHLELPDRALRLWSFPFPGGLVLFNRTGEEVIDRQQAWDWERFADPATGEVIPVVDGLAPIAIPAWSGRELLRLRPGDEPPPAPKAATRQLTRERLPLVLPLYDRATSRQRSSDSFAGARSSWRRDETGSRILRIQTTGRLQAGGFRFDPAQPVNLRVWGASPGAALELKVRVGSRGTAAIEAEFVGEGRRAALATAISPISDWQLIRLPLDQFQPAGQLELATGLYLRFLPDGAGDLAAAWLSRPFEP